MNNLGENKAIREDKSGKGRYDLISPFAIDRLAKHLENGSKLYPDRNWEKGMPWSMFIDSAKRHITKFEMGMEDEDNLSAAIWNLMAIVHFQELGDTSDNNLPMYLKSNNKQSDIGFRNTSQNM